MWSHGLRASPPRPRPVLSRVRRVASVPRVVGSRGSLLSNITDIDDRIIDRANGEGRTAEEVAIECEALWYEGMDAINVKRPTVDPHATSYVADMVDLIQELVDRGKAYVTSDGVYLSVETVEDYGLLAHSVDMREAAGDLAMSRTASSTSLLAISAATSSGPRRRRCSGTRSASCSPNSKAVGNRLERRRGHDGAAAAWLTTHLLTTSSSPCQQYVATLSRAHLQSLRATDGLTDDLAMHGDGGLPAATKPLIPQSVEPAAGHQTAQLQGKQKAYTSPSNTDHPAHNTHKPSATHSNPAHTHARRPRTRVCARARHLSDITLSTTGRQRQPRRLPRAPVRGYAAHRERPWGRGGRDANATATTSAMCWSRGSLAELGCP